MFWGSYFPRWNSNPRIFKGTKQLGLHHLKETASPSCVAPNSNIQVDLSIDHENSEIRQVFCLERHAHNNLSSSSLHGANSLKCLAHNCPWVGYINHGESSWTHLWRSLHHPTIIPLCLSISIIISHRPQFSQRFHAWRKYANQLWVALMTSLHCMHPMNEKTHQVIRGGLKTSYWNSLCQHILLNCNSLVFKFWKRVWLGIPDSSDQWLPPRVLCTIGTGSFKN